MKKLFLLLAAVLLIFGLVACEDKKEPEVQEPEVVENTNQEEVNVPKNEQIGTAGSNMPLKDRYDDAEYEIKVAFQNWLAETYGEKVFDARIYVEKIYSYEEEQEIEGIRDLKLGTDEIAFDVRYELKPAEGADINELTIPNGEYDEESGWIKDCYRLGVLRPIDGGEVKYEVTNIGTGW